MTSATERDREAALIRESIGEIDARVTPTIGPTFGSDGRGCMRETREGRISSDDFQTLMGYALAGIGLAEDQGAMIAAARDEERERCITLMGKKSDEAFHTGFQFQRDGNARDASLWSHRCSTYADAVTVLKNDSGAQAIRSEKRGA